ncbi:MAG: tetratricopeptide repeat protein [Magnetococcales bacterium]|nr:tetratricopeptide repeat protein [Magnetococcales bacterium]
MAPEAIFAYAERLEAEKDDSRAATEYGRYIAGAEGGEGGEYPRLAEAMYRFAVTLAKAGETDRALLAFSRLGERFPESEWIDRALLHLGEVYEGAGDLPEAARRYQALAARGYATRLGALSQFRLAWIQWRQDEPGAARETLEQVDHPDFREGVSRFREGLGEYEEVVEKDPRVAGWLTAALPGAGHLYLGRPRDAFFSFFANGLLLGGAIQSFREGVPTLGVALGLIEAGWYTGSIFSAVSLAHRYNREAKEAVIERLRLRLRPATGVGGGILELGVDFE